MDELYKAYNYPSASKFKDILKKNNIQVTNKQIQEFINKQTVSQLHKPVTNYKRNYKFITTNEPFEMIQIDLLDYQKYSRTNNGNKYILIAIDIFSRYAFASPIKDKSPSNVLEGFKKFKISEHLTSIYHDSGNEFKGAFLKYLNENNIIDLKAEVGDHHSLGVIDRFSKTLKTIIAKYMTLHQTTKYIDELPKIIQAYNGSPHSSLNNLEPNNAFEGDGYKLVKSINEAKRIFNQSISSKQTNKIKIGDFVRVKLKKKTFQKGYEINYSKEIYEVINIIGSKLYLNDGSIKSADDVIIASNQEQVLENTEKDNLDKEAKVKRKLLREGIFYSET